MPPLFLVIQVRLLGDTTSFCTHSRFLRNSGFCLGEGKMQSKHSLKVRLKFPYKRVGNELRFWPSLKVKRQGARLTNRARDMATSKHKNGSKTNCVSSLPLASLCVWAGTFVIMNLLGFPRLQHFHTRDNIGITWFTIFWLEKELTICRVLCLLLFQTEHFLRQWLHIQRI